MPNQIHTVGGQPTETNRSRRPGPWRLAAGWNFALRQMRAAGWLSNQNQENQRFKIWLTAVGLTYATLLSVTALLAPKAMNFDWFYLFGCALIGWAAGARPAMVLVIVSALFLFYHDAFLRAPGQPLWIICWNSIVRLLAYGAMGRLAAEAGRSNRDLEKSVRERTARLQSEITEHKQTAELLNEGIELFRQVTENITDVFWVTDATKTVKALAVLGSLLGGPFTPLDHAGVNRRMHRRAY